MKGISQLLPGKQALRLPLRRRAVRDGLLALLGGLALAGLQINGQALPAAACLITAFPLGVASAASALGAALGYLLCFGTVEAAQWVAMSLLMLTAAAVFHGTAAPARRWFFPSLAMVVCLVLGAVYLLGGEDTPVHYADYFSKALLAALLTGGFRAAMFGESRCKLLLTACLLAGASGWSLPVDLGLSCCAALSLLQPAATAGGVVALELTGKNCAAVILLPVLLWRILNVRTPLLRTALAAVCMPATLLLFGEARIAAYTSVLVGLAAGLFLTRFPLLTAILGREANGAEQRLLDAAELLDSLRRQIPDREDMPVQSEADSVYDGAAEQVCRCCAFFHRCWNTHAADTYEALTAAAPMIMETGKAQREHFSTEFQTRCCHFEGFLTAVNQELEGMLYRRRYRIHLRESRRVLAEELGCMAQFLRSPAPEQVMGVYQPRIGVSSVGRRGSRIVGDRGACFAAPGGLFYVLLCDGMGSGAEAAQISGESLRFLERYLRSGVEPEAALRMMNGAYLLRDTGCFSTVDLLCIDLRDGVAALYKWGAAASYLRDGDKLIKIGTAALPPGVGVGGEHAPERYELSLRGGEVLVMVSDGVDTERLQSEVAAYRGDSPRELAMLLTAELSPEDDETAIAVGLRTS